MPVVERGESATIGEVLERYRAQLAKTPDDQELLVEYGDALLDFLCLYEYAPFEQQRESEEFRQFKEVARRMDRENCFTAVCEGYICLVNGRNELVVPALKRAVALRKDPIDCKDFARNFLQPFGAGFPGLWRQVGQALRQASVEVEPGLGELCDSLEALFWSAKTDERFDEAVDALEALCLTYPDNYIALELLGSVHYNAGRWKNALAIYRMAEKWLDDPEYELFHYFFPEWIWFDMAWCCKKSRDLSGAETYYRKALDRDPEMASVRNWLGYCLYRQGKYAEAEKLFRSCIEREEDLKYAVNNLARLLLATGRLEEARQLKRELGQYISTAYRDRIDEGRTIRGKAVTEPEEEETEQEACGEAPAPKRRLRVQEFASERGLEDALVAQMEKGQDVFGLGLKVYDHKGDRYGRQYRTDVGIIDILAEDPQGDLWAVELKKDAGYDDPYLQTLRYVEWLERNKAAKGQKVYGLICTGAAKPQLVQQVREDPRVRLFTYRISYREIV